MILDGKSAVMLESASTDAVEEALQTLSLNTDRRLRIATTAHLRYSENFRVDRHLDRWEALINRVGVGKWASDE
jgi:glycosyltransferase involved in cell wall biosynthesis